jgi:ketopantoate hydroxymethyltransferase
MAVEAISAWADDVRSGAFPSEAETYHLPADPGTGSA